MISLVTLVTVLAIQQGTTPPATASQARGRAVVPAAQPLPLRRRSIGADSVPAEDTLPDDFYDEDPDGQPDVDDDPGSPEAMEIDSFLASAMRGLADNDVVRAACKGQQGFAQYRKLMDESREMLDLWKNLNRSFGGSGTPMADPATAMATKAYAKAVSLGAKAEAWSATFAIGSLCNTSETARLAGEQFDFLRNVVNRNIDLDLPDLAKAVDDTKQQLDPVRAEVRAERFARLFGRFNPAAGGSPAAAVAVLDSTSAEAYSLAGRADSLANAVMPQLAELAAEVQNTDSSGCAALNGSGPPVTGQEKCGPVSPGRADQITATALLLNGSQMAMLSQLSARRMDVEAAKVQADLRAGYVTQAGAVYRGRRP